MFSTRNTQASSTTRNPDQDVATAPDIKTSTSVVNSLARSLVGASPGQVSIAAYLKFQYPAGKRPGAIEKHWLGLRKVATHMKTVELQAIQTGRKVRGEDRIMAARRSVNFLHTVIKSIGVEETNHPSFRKELIEHLENIVRWYPGAPFAWAMAYKSLLPGEFLTFKGSVYDKDACRSMMIHMTGQEARAAG
ncbi:MAG: hypothetical protein RLO04_12830 [Limnobacter sp.]|uniref:hypothetical protein n=1 Tax=Limnobacter sp. TaxID=2003368 RepID=UPI0032EBBDC1